MYPSSYLQPGMGGPGYPMPPQTNLMMGMPQQGPTGLDNVFNEQANAMKIMNMSLLTPYVPRSNINEGDNDDSDCDETHNEKKDLTNHESSGILLNINTQTNPFKYLVGASAENWHKYYDFDMQKNNIYKDFVYLNNKNYPSTKEQEVDMEILRRVVKQSPILMAKTWITRSIVLSIIVLIIMICIPATKLGFIIFGAISITLILACLYDWQFNSKGRGVNRWSSIKTEIGQLATTGITIKELYEKIDSKYTPKEPLIIHHNNQPAQPTQQSGTGVIQGIATVANLLNK